MRSVTWWFCLVGVVAGIMLVGSTAARAEEGEGDKGEQREHMAPPPPPPESGPAHHPGGPGVVTVRTVWSPGVEATFWRALRTLKCIGWTLLAIHILLASWVFMDIRKRGEGHGIFVALALLAGIPATILYALVRLGDMKKS